MKNYRQLSPEQRYTIECLLNEGFNQKQIAGIIGRSPSTISRELKRNVNKRGRHAGEYDSNRAQQKTNKRHRDKAKHRRLEDWHLEFIRDKLKEDRWSPEYCTSPQN